MTVRILQGDLDPVRCPMCGRLLRLTSNVYEYDKQPPYTKRKVGEKPAVNLYAPFCTLRCGWSYGRHHYEKGRKKHG